MFLNNINIDLDIIEFSIYESKIKNMIIKLKEKLEIDKITIPAESLGKIEGIKFGDNKTFYYCIFNDQKVDLERKSFSFVTEK